MVPRALFGLREYAGQQSAEEGPSDSERRSRNKPHVLGAGQDRAGEEPADEAKDDRPEHVNHISFLLNLRWRIHRGQKKVERDANLNMAVPLGGRKGTLKYKKMIFPNLN